ncbi:hypothetical protein QC761_406520 [Podospora bellae-mahoneyi]|uniref:Uncharacterized protein n=1 Tax=Podospora bellae-mahoneyi TaxID=2093777 RepID=A0ABR0FKP8_9PEZI|nr:hypothetical protein QC761_406520 [Podospora bellae-mahoneyi]
MEQRQSQLAGKVTKTLPKSRHAQTSVSRQNGGLFRPEELGSESKDPYDLSEDSQDDHEELRLRRPAKKARLSYVDRPAHSSAQNYPKSASVAVDYPTPKLTSELANASSTVNLWSFSSTDDLDAANPGSLAATVSKLDQLIDETYLQQCHPATPGTTLQTDANGVLPSARHTMSLCSLPDSTRTWGHSENGNKQEDGPANHNGPPRHQETQELPYADCNMFDSRGVAVNLMSFSNMPKVESEDESYSVTSLDEEDLVKLADSIDRPSRQSPPTSMLRDMSSISSVGTYDPDLKRSFHGKPAEGPEEDEDLMDSDIDWSPIVDQLASQARPHSVDPPKSQPVPEILSTNSQKPELAPSHQLVVRPFNRPPFPSTLRDKSPVCGLSNNTVSRTCFRLGHLIAENVRNSSQNRDVVYELYARVNYSHRNRPSATQIPLFNVIKHDNSFRTQHFQFMDLWKDLKPHVWGVLENWRPDGVLDKLSSIFLSAGPPPSQFSQQNEVERERKLCRCICRISKAPKGASQAGGRNKINNPEIGGWSMKVLWIEEVGWDAIEKMKSIICQE